MQNSPTTKELLTKSISNPKTTQLILHKINLKEKPRYKKYIKQFFENPKKFFTSNYANKIIIMNKFKSPEELFVLPLPPNLLRRYKRKNKGVQLINDTSMKEQLDDMVSVYNNQTKKKRKIYFDIKKDKEDKRDKRDKREITDEEIQKIFNAFENVRNINKNRINNFITKNEYVDLIYKNKSYNEINTEKKNDEINEPTQEKNNININNNNDNIKLKKLIKSKSSLAIRSRNDLTKDDLSKKIISAKIVKFNDKININFNTNKSNDIVIPKLPSKLIKKSGTFVSIFEEKKNNNNNYITTNSQHSTLYKTRNIQYKKYL